MQKKEPNQFSLSHLYKGFFFLLLVDIFYFSIFTRNRRLWNLLPCPGVVLGSVGADRCGLWMQRACVLMLLLCRTYTRKNSHPPSASTFWVNHHEMGVFWFSYGDFLLASTPPPPLICGWRDFEYTKWSCRYEVNFLSLDAFRPKVKDNFFLVCY